jgi:hypothetical protein
VRALYTHAPGITPYDVTVSVAFEPVAGGTRMTLDSTGMHDARWQQLASQGRVEQFNRRERMLDRRT